MARFQVWILLLLFVGYFAHSSSSDHINFIYDRIYVGDQTAAGNLQMLQQEYNITAVLNVAWDLDIRYPVDDYVGSIADDNEHLYMQYNKVGLVDGTGNLPSSLVSGIMMLQQFLTPRVLQPKDRATYPQPVQNVLVHCHSGHSRSVTIAALYLNYAYQTVFPTYDVALQFVKTKRGIQNDTNVPEPALTFLARSISNEFGKCGCGLVMANRLHDTYSDPNQH